MAQAEGNRASAPVGGQLCPLGPRERVAWLLRINRQLGGDRELSTVSAFARAFRGGSHPGTAGVSTVSRWETGRLNVSGDAIRRYEELLGLPPHLLTAAARTTLRYLAPSALERPPLAATATTSAQPRTEELLEQALSGDDMTGADWAALAGDLAAIPDAVLMPAGIWRQLTQRLVEEMVIAGGVAWMMRFEALNQLLNHPRGGPDAIARCAGIAADRANHASTEVICALDNTAHPDSGVQVLAQLTAPTSDRAFQGALMACARKVAYGHFTRPQLDTVSALCTELLGDGEAADGVVAGVAPLAAQILRSLPDRTPARLRRGLLDADGPLGHVWQRGRLAGEPGTGLVVRRIVARAVADATRDHPSPPGADTLGDLHGLVDEMLFSPVFDIRLYTAMLLYATPLRRPLAEAVATELARPATARDAVLAPSLLGALRVLGDHRSRPLVQRLTTALGLPEATVLAAAHCLGDLAPGEADDHYWTDALSRHSSQWALRRAGGSAMILQCLVYGMGMSSRYDLLTTVRDDPALPAPARAAARWWTNVPERARRSARR
uniref:Helix-turn-helix domain-containing protein n=1 Tax=Streptomyces sp. NBC_00093 TaxID=2975649 RepID=A0AAU2A175_9ACTN